MQAGRLGERDGLRVLVVKDEFYLADDLRRALVNRGADVVGLAATVGRARALVAKQHTDFAVLEVNLKGEMVFAVADELRRRGVPFVFTTGYDEAMVPAAYRDMERREKPFAPKDLVAATIKS